MYIPILQLRGPGPPSNHLPQGVAHLPWRPSPSVSPVPSCVLMGPLCPNGPLPCPSRTPMALLPCPNRDPRPLLCPNGGPCPSGFKCGVNGAPCGPVILTSSLPLTSRHGSSPGPGAVGAGLLCKMG